MDEMSGIGSKSGAILPELSIGVLIGRRDNAFGIWTDKTFINVRPVWIVNKIDAAPQRRVICPLKIFELFKRLDNLTLEPFSIYTLCICA